MTEFIVVTILTLCAYIWLFLFIKETDNMDLHLLFAIIILAILAAYFAITIKLNVI